MSDQLYREWHTLQIRTRHLKQFRRRINAPQVRDAWPVKREIETGANPDINDAPGGARNDTRPTFGRGRILHRQVDQPGKNVLAVESHALARRLTRPGPPRTVRQRSRRASASPDEKTNSVSALAVACGWTKAW